MCELMTIAAAAVFTGLHFACKKRGKSSNAVFATMLAFWGAALMWSVDCVAEAMEGEPLLDISTEDFVLGLIILSTGIVFFGVLSFAGKMNAAKKR